MEIKLRHIDVKINTEPLFYKERNGMIIITRRPDNLYDGYYYYKNKHGNSFEVYLVDTRKETLVRGIREKIRNNITMVNTDLLLIGNYPKYKSEISRCFNRLSNLSTLHSLLGTIDKQSEAECRSILNSAHKAYTKFIKHSDHTFLERIKATIRYTFLKLLISMELSKI